MRTSFFTICLCFIGLTAFSQHCSTPMVNTDFKVALQKVQQHDFDEAKKEEIKTLINNCIKTSQLKALLAELSFEEDKVELATLAYPKISDPKNFATIKSIFDFEESKKKIDKLMK